VEQASAAMAAWCLSLETFHRFVERLLKGFEKFGVYYAFTGALASSFYGVPRTTVDVDVMVYAYDEEAKNRLVEALREAGLKADLAKVNKALRSGYRIATFMDSQTPYSVDIIFSDKKFRRKTGMVCGLKAYFQAPEDLILAKLRMIKATVPLERAQKDVEDVKAILKFTRVDLEAIKRKAEKEGTLQILEGVMAERD
jgi:hypothetical protein